LINGDCSKLPSVEQPAVTDPYVARWVHSSAAYPLGTVAVPWTVAGRRVVDEPARRGPAAFVPSCCRRCADLPIIQRIC
jgi:hypothetical protein